MGFPIFFFYHRIKATIDRCAWLYVHVPRCRTIVVLQNKNPYEIREKRLSSPVTQRKNAGFPTCSFFISKCSKPLCSKGFRAFYELTWKSLKSLKIWPVARRLHFGCTPVSSIFHCIIRVFFFFLYMVFFQKNEGSAVWRQLKGAHRMRKVSIHYVT